MKFRSNRKSIESEDYIASLYSLYIISAQIIVQRKCLNKKTASFYFFANISVWFKLVKQNWNFCSEYPNTLNSFLFAKRKQANLFVMKRVAIILKSFRMHEYVLQFIHGRGMLFVIDSESRLLFSVLRTLHEREFY